MVFGFGSSAPTHACHLGTQASLLKIALSAAGRELTVEGLRVPRQLALYTTARKSELPLTYRQAAVRTPLYYFQ